jgi:hypothetical protein
VKVNGVELGPDSPLLTNGGARRYVGPSEADSQIALLELLVGPARAGGGRAPGAGMTTRFPELALIYAINPNKGGQHQRAARGIAKAMGQLAGMPDLHLPVARGRYIGLYLELKAPRGRHSDEQLRMARALLAQGHCVAECVGVHVAASFIIDYLRLAPGDGLLGESRA